jgi:hypothetical protein
MFANRFTAFVDACSLTGALKRNLLLTLAEAEFFRLRWSARVLDETQIAIEKILEKKGLADAAGRAARARQAMETAFEDATVEAYEKFLPVGSGLPDAGDAHVLAAALKTGAHIIVTDNLKDFPKSVLKPLNLEALSTDQFVANTIALDGPRSGRHQSYATAFPQTRPGRSFAAHRDGSCWPARNGRYPEAPHAIVVRGKCRGNWRSASTCRAFVLTRLVGGAWARGRD